MLWRATANYLVLAQHDGSHTEIHGPGATVWKLISEPTEHVALIQDVAREYRLRPEQLDGDVTSILDVLREAGYVRCSDS